MLLLNYDSKEFSKTINKMLGIVIRSYREVGESVDSLDYYKDMYPYWYNLNLESVQNEINHLEEKITDNYLHSLTPLENYILLNILDYMDEFFYESIIRNELFEDINYNQEYLSDELIFLIQGIKSPTDLEGFIFEDMDFHFISNYINLVINEQANLDFLTLHWDIDIEMYKDIIPPDIMNQLEKIKKEANSVEQPNEMDFYIGVKEFLAELKHKIEHRKGHLLINNKNGHINEESLQAYISNLADIYFKPLKISVDREVDTGRGKVDFKISFGREQACLVEVKLSNHLRIKDGYEFQLPTYLYAEKIKLGFFILVCLTAEDFEKELDLSPLEKLSNEFRIECVKINASGALKSASKIRNQKECGI